MKWLEFKQQVIDRHNMCKDTVVRVRDIQLRGMPNSGGRYETGDFTRTPLKAGNVTIEYATKQGLASLLDRIGIPAGFFSKCTPALAAEILKEFLIKHADKSMLLRTMNLPQGTILRFAGSPKYDIYNDVDAVGTLSRYIGEDQVLKRVFVSHDRTEFMVLLTTRPLRVVRDFGVALRIVNSETGCSQLRIDIVLFELVCTNGLIVPKRIMPSFNRVHVRAKESIQLVDFMDGFLPKVGAIAEQLTHRLNELKHMKANDILDKFFAMRSIPKNVKDAAQIALTNYGTTALDAVSAITEVARDMENVELQDQLQTIAGELAF